MNVQLNPKLLDVVELEGVEPRPSASPSIRGTVVEIFTEPTKAALIEVLDQNGVPRDFVTRPIEHMKTVWTAPESVAMEVERDDPQRSFEKGILLLQNGLIAEAKHHFAQAFALEPRLAASLVNSTNILAQRGVFDAAIFIYELILELQPQYALGRENLAITHLNRGVQYARLRAIDKAVDDFNAALALGPSAKVVELARQNLVAAYTQLGILHAEIRRYQEALANFVAAFQLNPSDITRKNLALTLVSLSAERTENRSQLPRATFFTRAMQMGLTLSECLNAYGATLAGLGQLSEARRALEAAVEADSTNELAKKNLGILLARGVPFEVTPLTFGLESLETQSLQQSQI